MFELIIYFMLRRQEANHTLIVESKDAARNRMQRIMQDGLWVKAGQNDLYVPPHQIIGAVCKQQEADEIE